MEAIILAGGFGTRLKDVVSNVPKPMAPINNIPFLKYILDYVYKNGVNRVILAVGYKHDIITNYFGNKYKGMDLIYSIEDKPLFTGGAIKKALNVCKNKNVLVVNGDTYLDVRLEDMMKFHDINNGDITVAIKHMENFNRYGTVELSNIKIIQFNEKQQRESGFINGGIYILNKSLFNNIRENKFSFEKDIMEKLILDLNILGFITKGYFIDIGIPSDYYKAQNDFKYYTEK
ncbi:D-glycero-D-manno-heptose 1-phosphate guanosyltransferase [Romboutsia maritimum]|uniref:D-glycero-D-manno-heptose 1-phosphate guanosyltransferase n=1 Tax=Romboutsia maritimum TaxID=2020948 RepID=A0A371IS03_9FIRM|nr:nucleotidyltransferase family protein [Romboutsia maritimum]RDY23268.1 D-glycero-D-manno-heptose 1-phosphate guanosyltransferase [Romboutsia maritimum]